MLLPSLLRKKVLPLNEEPRRVPPPRGPVKIDAQFCAGFARLLAVSLRGRCIQRVSIWLTLYTCDDSRAQYLACNSLILRKQN